MRKKISNFRFEKFVFFLFLFALALISAKSAAAQIIMSNSSNILEIKASSTLTNSVLKFVPSNSTNSFSLQAIANPVVGASTVSIFDYLSSTSTFKMLNGTLNYNPSNNYIGIGTADPGYKFDVSGTGRFTAKLMLDAAEGLGVYGIRGRTSNEQVEMYQKVSIGSPNGWGTFPQAPGGGLSVYGGANFATNNGNVGIGTTTPAAKLSVSGGNIFITDAVINSGTPHAAITKTYLDSALETYGSKWILNGSKLYASSTAWNVGIGTAAPGAKLEVEIGNSGTETFLLSDSFNNYGLRTGHDGYAGLFGYQQGNDTGGGGSYGTVLSMNAFYNGTSWSTRNGWIIPSFINLGLGGNIIFATQSNHQGGTAGVYTPTEVMRLTNSGNVGIGTTAPGAFRLYVNGATYTSGNLNVGGDATITGGDVSISNNNGGINFNDASAYWLKTATNWGIYWDTTANQFKFNGAGVTKASIDLDDGAAYFNGSVGIGTTTPEAKLSVSGGNIFITDAVIGSSTPHAAITKTYLDSAIRALASTTSYWAANGTHIFNTNTGNVGVGTSNPGQQLEITKNFRLPATVGTSAYGVIYKGISSFIHDFNYGLNGNGITTAGGNTFVGLNAGNFTMGSTATSFSQSSSNTGVGYYSLFANTTGYSNSALGYQSLLSNTTGHSNSALGYLSLSHNTTGYGNSALGYLSLENNTTGGNNSALGFSSLRSNTTGGGNSAFGYDSLVANSTGFFNSAFGDEAGKLLATGGVRTTGDLGLYLGYSSKASADGTNNEIVIGALAVGNGSNSVTLGNDSIAKTVLKGNVGIGTSTPSEKLSVLGNIIIPNNFSVLSRNVGNNVSVPLFKFNTSDALEVGTWEGAYVSNTFVKGGNGSVYVDFSQGNNANFIVRKVSGVTPTELMRVTTAGNVGIGTTTPAAKLSVSGGNIFITDAVINSGTPHAAITKTYLDSALGAIGNYWSANGTNIYNANTGNVGIGVNTPLAKLQINNEAAFNTLTPGPAAYYGLHFGGQTTADYATGITWNGGTSGTQAGIYVQGSGSYGSRMYFATTNSYATGAQNRMIINEGGNVGIGTTAPGAYKLYVNGATYTSGNLNTGGNLTVAGDAIISGSDVYDNSGDLHLSGEDSLYFKMDYNNDDADTRNIIFAKNTALGTVPTGVNELMRITETGNVSIGDIIPAYRLDVKGEGNFGNSQVHGVSAPSSDTDAANQGYVKSSVEGFAFWKLAGSNLYASSTTWNVGIGNNAPAQKLDVTGSINSSAGYKVNNSAVSGNYLRGNGSNFVASTIQAGDVPTLNQNTSGYAGYLISEDNRSISPSELARNMMKFGFTSYKNDNSYPYADFLHFNSYADSSGGNDNLLVFNKRALGMRLYQEVFGSASPYTKYKDVVLAENTPAANYLTKYSTVGDEVTVAASSIYDNGTYVGIGTATPTSKLHVVGSSYLNGTIKTALTGTGSRCLHVDSNGVIGTMAGDCGTSTGGDNLGNGIASTNIALGNYWLSGDGNNEGIFVNSTGNVGIGTSNPTNNLTINVPTATTTNIDAIRISSSNMVYGTSLAFGASAGPAGNRIKSVLNSASKTDLAFEVIDAEIMRIISNGGNSGLAILATTTDAAFNVGNKTKITSGGYIYNANNSRWLDLTGTTGDSLKVASDLNTTGGSLKVSGTGNSWIMGKLGIGTTNPATTAGMTIDTPVASSSILFRAAGTDRAILSFKNGFFLGKDDTTSFSYSGVSNIGIGHGALERGSGDGNIAIGEFAAYYNNAANNNIAIGNGAAQVVNTSGNIALGWQAFGSSGATGGNNIAIGVAALANGAVQKNIAIGDGALNTASVGSYNIAIGNRGAAGSNKLYIGDLTGFISPYTPLIYGDMTSTASFGVGIGTTTLGTTTAGTVALTVAGNMFATGAAYADGFYGPSAMGSDIRLKHDIKTLSEEDYRKVFKLRPVSFTYNKDNRDDYGFIAQEVQKLYPETVTNGGDGNLYIYYNSLIAPTVAAVQAQEKKIEEQETLINILLDRVNKLENSAK